ncbi:hypothetical protein DEU56DRAFT_762264 [Suillus clintonianus]|uniref:uncharacterized protein n=1 Tax=Suillus clintonianus TaxID=1904413 RepID=UPI001B87F85A|nr:uncharacterized protein DEU56DRAFT_762264 [Suillus clintonianus]KAG2111026.1 hypothetical protein DEU56DRAFT_762264 [Suillus clintonianus]
MHVVVQQPTSSESTSTGPTDPSTITTTSSSSDPTTRPSSATTLASSSTGLLLDVQPERSAKKLKVQPEGEGSTRGKQQKEAKAQVNGSGSGKGKGKGKGLLQIFACSESIAPALRVFEFAGLLLLSLLLLWMFLTVLITSMASGAQPATDTSLTGISPDQKCSHEPQTHLITQAIHAGTRAPVPPKPIGPFSAVSSSSTEGPVVNNTSSIHRTPSKSSISEAQHMSTVLVPTAMQGVLHSNLKHIGTPRAIGALRNRSPALLRHLTTPNVARSTLGLNANKVPSPVFSVKTESDSNCEDSDNESTHTIDTQARSSEEHKAQLGLNATRAQRDVCFAEKTLADCVVQQNRALGLLYQFEATEAGRKLEDAHIDIGYVPATAQRTSDSDVDARCSAHGGVDNRVALRYLVLVQSLRQFTDGCAIWRH